VNEDTDTSHEVQSNATTNSDDSSGASYSLPVVIGIGVLVGLLVVVVAAIAGKVYQRRKDRADDIEKDLTAAAADAASLNSADLAKLEPLHLSYKGSSSSRSFNNQRHPGALPIAARVTSPKPPKSRSPSPLRIDTKKANMFGNSHAPQFVSTVQRKSSTVRPSPLSAEPVEVEAVPEKSPGEINAGGDSVQSRGVTSRARNNSFNASSSLQVTEPYNIPSPTWVNGQPEFSRMNNVSSPTIKRKQAVDQFVKEVSMPPDDTVNDASGITVVVSSFMNQMNNPRVINDEEEQEPPVNVSALGEDYEVREMGPKSPQLECVNILDNAHYAEWNMSVVSNNSMHEDAEELEQERIDSQNGEEEQEVESWQEGLASYIIEEDDDQQQYAESSAMAAGETSEGVSYPEVWYRPSPAPTPRPPNQTATEGAQQARLHYQGKRPQRLLLQLKEEEEEMST
jgi:hypothetical protein